MKNEYLLEMCDISKSYIGVQALDKVSIRVRPGTVHALLGENGAGKSTLMKILAGETQADSGEMIIDGEKRRFANRKNAIECGISIIHQEMINVQEMTVAENMFLGREFKRKGNIFLNRKQNSSQTKKLLAEVGLNISPLKKMRDLTVAEMQMCEIAKAVSYDSRIFIMDEPTSAITETETEVLFQLIRNIISKGHSIIYISHKLDEIYEIADEITVLRDGKLVAHFNDTEVERNVLIKHMVDRDVVDVYPKRNRNSDGDVLLEVKDISIPGVFRNISFQVRAGEILGLAGLMGAGRTEIVEAIFGINQIEKGSLIIKGQKKRITSPVKAISNGIGLITDDRKLKGLIMGMNIKDNIVLSNHKSFKSKRLAFLDWRKISDESEKYKKLLKIKTPNLSQDVENLSGGNQQKVVLSKWLSRDCDIIIFDEPTRGIDIAAKSDFYHHISEQAEQGKAVIFISSEMEEVIGMCDRVLVLREGEAMGELSADDITQEKIMHYATLS